jgi:hypothetical protein
LVKYEFSKVVRRKHAKRYAEGANVIVLAPDVAEFFSAWESVSMALRALVGIGWKSLRKTSIQAG